MCESLRSTFVAVGLLFVSASGAPGQELEQRLDSLLNEWHAVQGAAEAAQEDPEEWASQVVQGITIITSPQETELVREALTRALGELPGWVGIEPLRGTILLLPPRGQVGPDHGRETIRIRSSRWAASPKARIRKGLRAAVARALPADIERWTGTINPLQPMDTTATYRALVASGIDLNRRCLYGDLSACTQALGLSEAGPTDTYTPAELRRWVAATSRLGRRGPLLRERCLGGNDNGACLKFLERAGTTPEVLLALPSQARHGLLKTALALGGVGALERLRTPEGLNRASSVTLVRRIEAAAHLPLDSVIQEWRMAATARAPGGSAPPFSALFASLAWLGLFSFFSARSTKWRLG